MKIMDVRRFSHNECIKHFKHETCTPEEKMNNKYMYRFICESENTETKEKTVVYQKLYDDFGVYNRPANMFYSEVDREKYPDIQQKYRFESVDCISKELFNAFLKSMKVLDNTTCLAISVPPAINHRD